MFSIQWLMFPSKPLALLQKKLGKKQQEEHHREVRRAHTAAAVASSHTPDPADPLARFKKR